MLALAKPGHTFGGIMIDREKWAQIYDMARYNGMSPMKFMFLAWTDRDSDIIMHYSDANEEEMYEVCLAYSRKRTNWPTSENLPSVA
jgi:hypothetical protein